MDSTHILVVEDDEDILELIRFNLAAAGYRVTTVTSGERALMQILDLRPNLILLDLMLPGINGNDLCSLIRENEKSRQIPIIMVTAKSEESDIVDGLEMGADDYISKPFSPKVLLARIKTVLRRKSSINAEGEDVVRVHELRINPKKHEVTLAGQIMTLTATEFLMLHFLARRPGWVHSRSKIVDGIKGSDYPVTDRAVDVTIVGLRKKLGAHSDYIETVRGVGYRFKS